MAAFSLPSDPDLGLSGTCLQDEGGRVEDLADLWEVVGEASRSVFCLAEDSRRCGDCGVGSCLEGKERGSVGGTSGGPPLDGFWSFWPLSTAGLSLTGPRTLLATVASWDTTLSMPLSGAWTGELELELEPDVDEDDTLRLAAAAAAHSLRLSASFFSLGMPGEEQEVRGVSWLSGVRQSGELVVVLETVVLVVALQSVVLVVVAVEGAADLGLSRVRSSALGSDGAVFPLRLFKSCGGAGLRKVSLLTEMNALPGVEKGRGP